MAHPTVVINGVTYSAVPSVQIPKSGSGTATFYDTSEADVAQGDILSGKKGSSRNHPIAKKLREHVDISTSVQPT